MFFPQYVLGNPTKVQSQLHFFLDTLCSLASSMLPVSDCQRGCQITTAKAALPGRVCCSPDASHFIEDLGPLRPSTYARRVYQIIGDSRSEYKYC